MSDSHPLRHTERRQLSTSTAVAPHLADCNIVGHTPGVDPWVMSAGNTFTSVVRPEVLIETLLKKQVFWDVMLCHWAGSFDVSNSQCLHLQLPVAVLFVLLNTASWL